jgi:hypothetical protein
LKKKKKKNKTKKKKTKNRRHTTKKGGWRKSIYFCKEAKERKEGRGRKKKKERQECSWPGNHKGIIEENQQTQRTSLINLFGQILDREDRRQTEALETFECEVNRDFRVVLC